MKFYRVTYKCDGGNSGGFDWFTNKTKAMKLFNREKRIATEPNYSHITDERLDDGDPESPNLPEIEEVEIAPTKAGILKALNVYAGHADNG